MPSYIVTGKLGAGKGKFGVERMRRALVRGSRVATNFDLRLDKLMGPLNKATAVRLPDRPSVSDLLGIGHGNPNSMDEDDNGEMHLDECASWLNTRSYSDKSRSELIDWFVHARKHGWNVYFYIQNINALDKQLREMIAEYQVKCIRADKFRIPAVGALLGRWGRLPRFHIANIVHQDVPGVIVDRDWYRGHDLHDAYDTRQIFRADYPHGPHSYLSAWHLIGRHQVARKRSLLERLVTREAVSRPEPRPKLPVTQLLSGLPPDEALRLASRYWRYAA